MRQYRLRISIVLLCISQLVKADVKPDPGDYTALPEGTDLLILYEQNLRAKNYYSDGTKIPDNPDLKLDLAVLKYVHFTDFFGTDLTWAPQAFVSVGRQETYGNKKVSGMGDATIGATIWSVSDRINNEYLGWSAFLTFPTGENKNDGFALSGNRYALDFQAAYIRKLTDNISWDIIAETEIYSDQVNSEESKDPLFQLHNHLRYNFTPDTWAGLTYRHSWGGSETFEHQTLTTSRNNSTAVVSLATKIHPQIQILGQVMRDIFVREGPKMENSLQLRVVYAY